MYEKADGFFPRKGKKQWTRRFSRYKKTGCLAKGRHFASAIILKVVYSSAYRHYYFVKHDLKQVGANVLILMDIILWIVATYVLLIYRFSCL